MLARPLHSAATLLAAVCLFTITLVPAPADARHHRSHAGAKKTQRSHAAVAAAAKKVRRGRARTGRTHRMRARFEGFPQARTADERGRRDRRRKPGGGKVTGSGELPSTGTGTGTGSSPQPADARDEPRFGVFTDDSPYSGNVDHVENLQGRLGRDIAIVNWYQSWGGGEWVSQVQQHVIKAVTDSGRSPLLTWEPWDPAAGADQPTYRLRAIADGAHDAYIGAWADALRDNGSEIFLRPMHEMNGNWYPWGAEVGDNSPALYKAAWRRMHDIFVAHGATNVRWVWCPLNADVAGPPMEQWYPGAAYVDVLALDGYNWGARHADYGGWLSFEQVFADAYKRIAKLGSQPIWIAEVGSAPQGGDKAQWVREMWATARSWHRLKALVWFDQNKEEDWSALPVASAFSTRG